jgi:SAM-dependent methyltransferase
MATESGDDISVHFNRWAPYFDDDHDPRWSTRLCAAFHAAARHHGATRWRLLDLGCGTGTGSLGLADLGYQVTACDIAPGMLRVAGSKPGAERVRFTEADLRALPDLGRHDVVIAMNDPFSHLLTDDEFTAALHGVAKSLAPHGVFVFDQHPLSAYRSACGRVTVVDKDDHMLIRRTSPDPTSSHLVYTFRMDRFTQDAPGDLWRRTTVRVRLRHRDPAHVARLLTEAGLEPLPTLGLDATGHLHAGIEDTVPTVLYAARPGKCPTGTCVDSADVHDGPTAD